MQYLLLVLVLAAGIVQPFQVAMNTKLLDTTKSPAIAAGVSFVGALLVTTLLYATGLLKRGSFAELAHTPWWAYLTGPLGVLIVVSSLVVLPKTSAALVIALLVFGQGASSLVVDHYGWLEVKKVPINAWRIAGVVLLLGGVLLMQKK